MLKTLFALLITRLRRPVVKHYSPGMGQCAGEAVACRGTEELWAEEEVTCPGNVTMRRKSGCLTRE